MASQVADELGRPRWRGASGRVEVWYATFSTPDGTGYWIHHETVAPTTAGRGPFGHGWAAVFPLDGSPIVERFGPEPVAPGTDMTWFRAAGARLGPGHMSGTAGQLSWHLDFADPGPPLFTFPRALWRRELLPGAQIVPWPRARLEGTVDAGGQRHEIDTGGAIARIYGHGNAERWCWLHADLGEGAVLELVSAVPRRAPLRLIPPVAMVKLRRPGEPDWPANPLLGAARFRTRIGPGRFGVAGRIGSRRLQVDVELPTERCVALDYTDPDGATATCTNSERANAEVHLEYLGTRRAGDQRDGTRRWTLSGTAHAEIGTRP